MFKSFRQHPVSYSKKKILSRAGLLGFTVVFATVGVAALLITRAQTNTTTTTNSIASYPTEPPARICGNTSILGGGPTTAPAGAVTVPAGDLVAQGINTRQSNTVYWFAPGIHTFGTGEFGQIQPGSGSTYIGAPGAIVDGQRLNRFAFTQKATNVTIKYLTIQNFVAPLDQGVVNHDAGASWTVEYNTISNNEGAGLMAGPENVYRYNCIKDNGQYGINSCCGTSAAEITNFVVDHNEIAGNNTGDWETKRPGCGCTGGIKFWINNGITVTNNWVHGNKGVGLWADNNNRGLLIEGNYIENNDKMGVMIEAGYDTKIQYNTFKRNSIIGGRSFQSRGDSFPVGTIYVSENGSPEGYGLKYAPLSISNNYFENNWGGISMWESPDRYCSSTAHTHPPACTIKVNNLYDDPLCENEIENDIPDSIDKYRCRWSTENVIIENNEFRIDKAAIGEGCVGQDYCGVNALFSTFGSYPEFPGYEIPWRITFQQNNIFRNNRYFGDWKFQGFAPTKAGGFRYDWKEWTAPAPPVPTEFTHANRPQSFGQDVGSTCDGCLETIKSGGGGGGQSVTPTVPNHLDTDTATLEGSAGKWAGWFSANATKSADKAQAGTSSLKVDVTAPYGWGVQLNNYPGFVANAGDKTISFWGINGSGPNTVKMNVHWRKADGTVLQKDTITLALNTSWQQAKADVVAPEGTAVAHVDFTSNTAGAGAFMYLDESYVGTRAGGGTTNPPTDITPPSAPTSLTAAATSSTRADLKWTAATDNLAVTKYYIVRNGVTVAELSGTTLTYSNTNLSPSTKYDYTVLAADAANNVSPPSNTASATTPALTDTTPPTPPSTLTATATSSTQVNLNWGASTDNVGVTGYRVYRKDIGLVPIATVTGTSFGNTNLTANTSYTYYVTAIDAAGNSSQFSNEVSVTTPAVVNPVTNGSISGIVTSNNGQPLAGARIKLTVNGVNYNYSTNSSGVYQITNLPPGTYSLNYSVKHHTAQTIQVTVTSGNNTTRNITLQRR